MKRIVAILLLLLYLHNFAGYLAAFCLLQSHVRSDIKRTIKSGLPDNTLTLLVFQTSSLGNDESSVQWLEENEFLYRGSMYDVVRARADGDSTYFLCINDVEEERLFAGLDRHVDREMAASGKAATLDSFQDVFKGSYQHNSSSPDELKLLGVSILPPSAHYNPFIPETIFHPPHTVSVS